jgi:hypothetical protein
MGFVNSLIKTFFYLVDLKKINIVMPTTIKCPSCAHEFPLEEAVSEEYKKELREQMVAYKKQKEEELIRKESEWKEQQQKRERELQRKLEEDLRKTIATDFENQIRLLQQNTKDNEEKLKEARQKELEFLRKEQQLKNKEAELEIFIQKKLQAEREKLSDELRKIEEQKTAGRENELHLKLKELEKQLDDQKKLAEEMRRKADQGSMQLQGEAQELALEDMLRNTFPFDEITGVGKGVRGADCIQMVRNNFGQECGKIIYESKRTNAFAADWIEKLKADMRSLGADIAVIVTKTMPKEMDCFGIRDGVWVCSFSEVKSLASVLRDGVIRVFSTAKSHENKGDKMHLLYSYLTSNEFAEQWKAIREGFMSMKLSIQKERDAMEKLWKSREKQLEKVLLNAAHIRGSIEGISGNDVDLNLLESGEEDD